MDPRKGVKSQKRMNAKESLEKIVEENPSISSRKAASALQVSQKLILTILSDDLHLKPFNFHHWHKLEERDYATRIEFAIWFLCLPPDTENQFIFSGSIQF